MKNAPTVANAIRTKHNVAAVPKATIEWNMNRYFDMTVYNDVVTGVEENDEDIYPIESIVQPWRPTKGINKARVNYGYASSGYNDYPNARFYTASEKDKYKYWMSPVPSDQNSNLPHCLPTIKYKTRFNANKIKVVVENSWSGPGEYRIQYTNDGGATWNDTVNAPVQNDGTIEVFWNGSTWTATKPANMVASLPMNGIRFYVSKMTGGRLLDGSPTSTRLPQGWFANPTGQGAYLSLIEMAPCLIRDISSMVISSSDTFDSGETSVVSPVGTLTTNTGSITLWNRDDDDNLIFSRDNKNSPYYGLIEQNAEVTYSLVYNIGTSNVEVRQFKMYVDSWNEEDSEMTLEMSDASKHLKEVKPLAAKYENMKFSEIMYRLCDSVGWNYYNVNSTSRAKDLRVPIFWTDGEQTLWEILDDLASVSQSIIYFDEYGIMNVKTREDAFSPDASPVWTLRSETAGSELSDIVSVDRNGEFGSNYVKIIYKNTRWADMTNGIAANSPVWEADDPTVLRSTPLLYTIQPTDMTFFMPGADAAVWPHQGQCVIEGEVIEYDAKEFAYQDGGAWKYDWVTTQSEQDEFNERVNSSMRHWNHCTGRFRIKERGQWNTPVKTHYVDSDGYNVVRWENSGPKSGGGFTYDRRESKVNIRTAAYLNAGHEYLTVTRGVPGDSPWRYIGTKMIFNNGNATHQAGGLVFNMQGVRDGYYVELCPTSQISEKDREVRNEMVFYVIKNGATSPMFPVKGAVAPVALDSWGELDVWYSIWDQRVKIFYRGKEYFHLNVPGQWQLSPSGKFGMFARGVTDVSFEYLYASSRHADPEPDGEYSAMHDISNVYQGRDFTQEWVHRNTRRERNKRKKTNKSVFDKNQRFMDEFGPYIHELKEYEVKFDPAPVAGSFLFHTNTWAAYMIDYSGDSFGARFTMVNTERYNAVLAGEDALLSPDDPVTQYLTVFGRALVIDEGEEVIAKNEQQIRARGEIVTEIDSNWIQSKEAAKEISEWIINHWSQGVDEITVDIFGNPLFHIGDVVAVDYPDKDMSASTHHYFVVGVSNSFDQGLSTQLRLRRRN